MHRLECPSSLSHRKTTGVNCYYIENKLIKEIPRPQGLHLHCFYENVPVSKFQTKNFLTKVLVLCLYWNWISWKGTMLNWSFSMPTVAGHILSPVHRRPVLEGLTVEKHGRQRRKSSSLNFSPMTFLGFWPFADMFRDCYCYLYLIPIFIWNLWCWRHKHNDIIAFIFQ